MTEATPSDHAPAGPEERRALDADELQMADTARQPALGRLSDRDLSDLVGRLRSRRNRARDLADRQRREARGKAAPAGATPATGDAGTRGKHDYLNAALDRALAERAARGTGDAPEAEADDAPPAQGGAPTSQRDLALKAMAMKKAGAAGSNPMTADDGPPGPGDPDADDGKANLADTERRTAPSGALDHAGELPSRERSRTRY